MRHDDIIGTERAVTRGLANFARILDGKHWEALGQVFAADLTFDYGSGVVQQGLPALRDQMVRFLDGCGPTQHLIGSILVDIDGDRVHSRAYVQARHQRKDDPAGAVFDSCGDYHDTWAWQTDGWRIIHRHAVWLIHTGDPAILGAQRADLD